MTILNEDAHFNNMAGLKTYAGAAKRIEKAIGGVAENERPLTFIVQNKKGEFVPVAIISDRTGWLITSLVHHGVYSTNAIVV